MEATTNSVVLGSRLAAIARTASGAVSSRMGSSRLPGATPKQVPVFARNAKFPLADNILPTFLNGPRWDPDRLYLSLSGKLIEVFDISTGSHLKTITTPRDVSIMATYFSQ